VRPHVDSEARAPVDERDVQQRGHGRILDPVEALLGLDVDRGETRAAAVEERRERAADAEERRGRRRRAVLAQLGLEVVERGARGQSLFELPDVVEPHALAARVVVGPAGRQRLRALRRSPA
jgi:hypothetical protein